MSVARVINPYSGILLGEYPRIGLKDINDVLIESREASRQWAHEPLSLRLRSLFSLKNILVERRQGLASLMTQEMGKPITQALQEVDKSCQLCDYYLEKADEFLGEKITTVEGNPFVITYKPQGLVLGVMPWNFPLWQVMRFAVPNLVLGNGVVVKHASNVQGSAEYIANIFLEALAGRQLYSHLNIDYESIEQVIAFPGVCGASLTGSFSAGAAIASLCGKYGKKSVLELGGSDPYLLCEDVDLELAIDKCVTSRLLNNGQSCIAAKRFVVPKILIKDFLDGYVERLEKLNVGDPLDFSTDLGPLAKIKLKEEVDKQVASFKKENVEERSVFLQQQPQGAFFLPRVFVVNNYKDFSFEEEIFAPVALVFPYEKESEGLDICNALPFGLGGAIFSRNLFQARRIALHWMDSGMVAINDFVRSHPALPFGGVKMSGYGRELAEVGLKEFANCKVVGPVS